MKCTFWGHACFLVETGEHRLVIDPFLTGNPKAGVKADDVECSFILVTHGHGDHIGDAVDIAKRTGATIISTYEIATYCGEQGVNAHPMHIGGAHDFDFGRLKLTIAHHGSGLSTPKGMIYMGNPAGMLITAEDKTIYHAGDTGLFLDMKLIGELHPIDLALLPIGDNFTMGIDDAVKAVEFLKPKRTVPIHYGTFDVIDVDPKEFVSKVSDSGHEASVLEVGGSIDV